MLLVETKTWITIAVDSSDNCSSSAFVFMWKKEDLHFALIYLSNIKWQSKITQRFLAVDDGMIFYYHQLPKIIYESKIY